MVKALENGDAQLSYKAYCLDLGEEIQAKCSNPKFHYSKTCVCKTQLSSEFQVSHHKGFIRNPNTVQCIFVSTQKIFC